MQVLQGNQYDCLGMDLDFSITGEFWVTIIDYLKKVILNLPEDIMRTPSPEEVG